MKEKDDFVHPEDYLEPRCLLCGEPYGVTPESRPVPSGRIAERLDALMSRRDYSGAERHLQYWLEEAKLGHDRRGELMIRNECIGYYRKMGETEKAKEHAEAALALLGGLDLWETITAGTVCVNIATARHAAGDYKGAAELFERAGKIYESAPETKPELLGGLYNNMALTYAALHRWREAEALNEKAMEKMACVPGGEAEQAITCLNMANAVEAEFGLEEGEVRINELLDRAETLLDSPAIPRDGYYAFVCEKCAPTFAYYGYFLESDTLMERAEKIYEGTRNR